MSLRKIFCNVEHGVTERTRVNVGELYGRRRSGREKWVREGGIEEEG